MHDSQPWTVLLLFSAASHLSVRAELCKRGSHLRRTLQERKRERTICAFADAGILEISASASKRAVGHCDRRITQLYMHGSSRVGRRTLEVRGHRDGDRDRRGGPQPSRVAAASSR